MVGNLHHKMLLCSVFVNLICLVICTSTRRETNRCFSRKQAAALQFLEKFNHHLPEFKSKAEIAAWKHQMNVTEANKDEMLKMQQAEADFLKESREKAASYAWKDLKDTNKTAYRLFKKLLTPDIIPSTGEKSQELQRLVADMFDIHSKADVDNFNVSSVAPCDLSLDPELIEICARSIKNAEQIYYWSQWRDVTGKKMRDKFLRYVELSSEVAKLNGYNEMGEIWRAPYESETFVEDMEELWLTLKPFYEHLHAYVRQKLRKHYPYSGIIADGPIPAHLVDDDGITWTSVFDIVSPYPGKESNDATKMMKEKNMTPLDMFKLSEEFFTSLGLSPMTPEFWHLSIIEKPSDREVVCHPTSWNFYTGKDFSITMCTQVDMENLMLIYHEMGHVEYYMQYSKQPTLFQDGANPGFHEAIGDTIALSLVNPEHLKKIGLLEEVFDDKEADINTLLRLALLNIASAPIMYLMDAWRWKVFNGSISKEELNQKWWELKLQYQGLCPPVRRTNEDLDAASIFHVANNAPTISYFVATIIQFQFHKALCDAAGHQGPLQKCDIYNSKEAGKVFSDMLSKGSSEPWEDALSAITKGKSRKLDATAIIEYYKPLIDWLEEQNENETIGWKSSDPGICPET